MTESSFEQDGQEQRIWLSAIPFDDFGFLQFGTRFGGIVDTAKSPCLSYVEGYLQYNLDSIHEYQIPVIFKLHLLKSPFCAFWSSARMKQGNKQRSVNLVNTAMTALQPLWLVFPMRSLCGRILYDFCLMTRKWALLMRKMSVHKPEMKDERNSKPNNPNHIQLSLLAVGVCFT